MQSHISPSAPGRIPWLGADLVEGPDLSDRHGLFLNVSGDTRSARRPPETGYPALAAGSGKEGPGPLVTMFASGLQAIPVTIVPGTLDHAAIDAIA